MASAWIRWSPSIGHFDQASCGCGFPIYPGDLVIVDRSIEAEPGHIVIAAVNCEPLCKRLARDGSQVVLKSENARYPSRYLLEGEELQVWGVVTYSVRSHDKA